MLMAHQPSKIERNANCFFCALNLTQLAEPAGAGADVGGGGAEGRGGAGRGTGSAPEPTEDKEPPEVLLKVSFISMFVLRSQEESTHGGPRQHRLHHEVL